MLFYQIILIAVSILGILIGIYRYYNEGFSNSVFVLWNTVWLIIIVVALFPGLTTHFANIFGFGRGLDSVYIFSIIFLFYIVFKLYNKIELQNKRINELVSQMALKEKEDE